MPAFPEEIRTFIRSNIDSVEQLNVLAFLRQHDDRVWTAPELSTELRSSPASIRRRLLGLVRRRLIIADADGYRYDPPERLDALVARVLDLFRERQTTVIETIFAGRDPLQSFADAFKLGDDADDT